MLNYIVILLYDKIISYLSEKFKKAELWGKYYLVFSLRLKIQKEE